MKKHFINSKYKSYYNLYIYIEDRLKLLKIIIELKEKSYFCI